MLVVEALPQFEPITSSDFAKKFDKFDEEASEEGQLLLRHKEDNVELVFDVIDDDAPFLDLSGEGSLYVGSE